MTKLSLKFLIHVDTELCSNFTIFLADFLGNMYINS